MQKLTPSLNCCLAGLLLLASGCGDSSAPTKSTKVIAPPKPAETATAETPAPSTPATSATPVAETPAKPEMAATPADSPATESAATTPAETPKAEETQLAAKPAEAAQPAPAAAGAQGTTFRGRVVVKGDAPKAAPITPSKDEVCIAQGTIPNDRVIVGEDGGLANVFVWLKRYPKDAKIPEPSTDPVVLDQKGCQFIPKAMVFQIGQPFLVKNEDATLHNTHTVPFVNSPGFNQGIQPNDRTGQEITYRRSEIIPVTTTCDIHPWMKSYHLPLEHPWAAVTDEHGSFEISGLPSGDVELALWHETGWVEKSLKLKLEDGKVVEQDFEVDASDLAE